MAGLSTTSVKRVFRYGSLRLPDPGESMTADKVRDLYAQQSYGELGQAKVDGPHYEGDTVYYDFVRAVRDKG